MISKILNSVIHADCLDVFRDMEDESVDLITTDPPYNTGRDFGEYNDSWGGVENFIDFINNRLRGMYRVLKPTGSMYLQ